MKNKKEKELEKNNKSCGCGDNCTCGDDCNCTEDNKCNENCTCWEHKEHKCDCGDHCDCGDDCDCGDCFNYEIVCPTCGDSIMVDEDILALGSIDCPNCGTHLEFDFDCDCDCDDDCDCDCCGEDAE